MVYKTQRTGKPKINNVVATGRPNIVPPLSPTIIRVEPWGEISTW